jgi:hypothetical protein
VRTFRRTVIQQQEVARRQGRPIPGNSPHDRLVSRGIFSSLKESLRCSPPATSVPAHPINTEAPQYAFFEGMAESIWSDGVQKQKRNQNQTPGQDRAASRRSAPSPGKRTRREDHAPSHRPQMSSGRLFLDRVARQHCPSPLHRHGQNTMHFARPRVKGDVSTLPGRGHFYFALTPPTTAWT